MNEDCQRYLEDPEANAAHLRDCAECRAVFDALGLDVEAKPLHVGELPLASWEGAAHRPWPLIAAGTVAVVALAIAVYFMAGLTPLRVFSSEMTRLEMLRDVLRLTSAAVRNAPMTWQVTIGVLFVIVNTILVLLLRRAPRGIDA
jgi:ABC-type amino acid transport system permease subunit